MNANSGGCWFCFKNDQNLVFDFEFDTYVHKKCIEENLKIGNPEAELLSYLLKD